MRPDDDGEGGLTRVPRRSRRISGAFREFAQESGLDAEVLHLEALEEQERRGNPVPPETVGGGRTVRVTVRAEDEVFLRAASYLV